MADPTCKTCASPLLESDEGRVECNACRFKKRARIACSECGGPTGWTTSHAPRLAYAPTCQSCRRSSFDHGTRKGYRDHKCRCHQCSKWANDAAKAYRQRRRAEGRPLPGGGGPWINPNVRQSVFERDNWTCQLCNGLVDRDADPQSDWYPSLDHIVPQSKGGGHGMENLRTTHRWCNSIRGANDHHAYLFEGVA